ncbi:hypothetical protein Q4Q35_17110 [Flavivirga aquimarina]|uniref:DUF4168 domain-containing protein n=1 Tax=Flavivirga aquimarina TaxID=2027862 RepID=A0ABT8WES7_9FLAO|nr:hypothetical protein [Flavivirga aquimarina]MDO5971529.1 hypothetical protein [Flavivirga aquimarina]
MRKLLLLICTLSFSITYSQPPGGGGGQRGQGGGQGGQMQERPQREVQEFDASKMAGIFTYDDAIVIKKLKIKKKHEELILDVRKAIANYNRNVQEIGLLNKDNFDTLNVYVNAIMKASMASRGQNRGNQQMNSRSSDDRGEENNPMREAMELAKEKINPAREAVKEEEGKLNKSLETILNEKQYKKWLKYQEDVKEALKPKQESNDQNNQMRGQGGGRMGGPPGGGMR